MLIMQCAVMRGFVQDWKGLEAYIRCVRHMFESYRATGNLDQAWRIAHEDLDFLRWFNRPSGKTKLEDKFVR